MNVDLPFILPKIILIVYWKIN